MLVVSTHPQQIPGRWRSGFALSFIVPAMIGTGVLGWVYVEFGALPEVTCFSVV